MLSLLMFLLYVLIVFTIVALVFKLIMLLLNYAGVTVSGPAVHIACAILAIIMLLWILQSINGHVVVHSF